MKEKLNTEMEPLFKNEARAIMIIRAMLLKAKPKVRGSEVKAIFLTSWKSIEKENLGVNPELCEARA